MKGKFLDTPAIRWTLFYVREFQLPFPGPAIRNNLLMLSRVIGIEMPVIVSELKSGNHSQKAMTAISLARRLKRAIRSLPHSGWCLFKKSSIVVIHSLQIGRPRL
jgi:hypothetical protein